MIAHRQGGKHRGRHAEPIHEGRLGTVLSAAAGDAGLVQYDGDILRMNSVEHKGQHLRLVDRRSAHR